MHKSFVVYLHKSPSGKYYVGITRQLPEARWKNGIGYKSNKKFYNAIQKYGWEQFDHIIVAKNLSESDARKLEMKLIEKYDSFNNGYNQTMGGEKPAYPRQAYVRMKEVLAKPVSQYSKDGVLISDFDSISDASKDTGVNCAHISGCINGRNKSAGGYLWTLKGHSPPHYNTRRRNLKPRRVYQLSAKDASVIAIYESVKEASEHTGIKCASIQAAYNNPNNYYAYGFYWAAEDLVDKKRELLKKRIQYGRSGYEVLCVTTGEKFYNLKEAAAHYNILPGSISACCCGKTKYSGEHPVTKQHLKWRYVTPNAA